MAEDDVEDQMLMRKAFEAARVPTHMEVVSDGEELLDCLHKRGRFTRSHRPDLILLDLNMPRCNGHEALEGIKRDPALRSIPVIVLTTSTREEDIVLSYSRGVSSFISKPATFDRLIQVAAEVGRYWAETVTLPPNDH
jgi:CheY-like chemotaxis protein